MFPHQFLQVYVVFVSLHCREFSNCRVTLSITRLQFNKSLLPVCQPGLSVLFLKSSIGRRIPVYIACYSRRCFSVLPSLRVLANLFQSPLHNPGFHYHSSLSPPKDGDNEGLHLQVRLVHLLLLLFLLAYNEALEIFSSFFWI